MALAAALALAFVSTDAAALALGRVNVQSALGEPLRAEIDVPEINADEVASLKANIAAPATFRSAGLEFSPALQNVTITLQRRANGSYFLRLTSDRAVNEPFVDVILEATWASGRVQRDFTLLIDPPTLRGSAPPAIAAQTGSAPAAAARAGTRTAPRPSVAATPGASTGATPGSSAGTPPGSSPAGTPGGASSPARTSPADDSRKVTVQRGDSAGKIAAANKPASISLDQMLVAMLRSNPDAFIGGNVNRLRSGVVLDMPSEEQAGSIPNREARQTLVAQSRDFNEFRRRLAEGLPAADVPAASREAGGRVQAQVEDKGTGAPAPDRLTLSKGAVQGRSSADEIARERASRDASTRVAELNKNLAELNRLAGSTPGAAGTGRAGISAPAGLPAASAPATPAGRAASAPVTPATPVTPAATAAAAVPAAATAAATTPAGTTPAGTATAATTPAAVASAAAAAASAPAGVASAPAGTASAPAAEAPVAAVPAPAVPASAPAARKPVPPPPPPETSFLDDVLENPLVPALGVGLLAVLLGLGFYKVRQKRKAAAVDSSFLESRLQPDSFFGASGGQRVDTAETANPTGSSMVYSPSQLDAAGDVDPVAEADVYLAYGRDLQAEEILKEALRINPQRVAIHAKLLEIYAKRRDAKAFETVAAEAYKLTRGAGTEWDHICELGRELDAANPMYRPGGQPDEGAIAAAAAAAAAVGTLGSTVAMPAQPEASSPPLDLDLDFSLPDEPAALSAPVAAAVAPVAATAPTAIEPPSLDLDFDDTPTASPAPISLDLPAVSLDLPPLTEPPPARVDKPDLALHDNSLNFDLDVPGAPTPAKTAAPAAAAAPADSGMIEFDLGSLSLDLPDTTPAPKAATLDVGLDRPPTASVAKARLTTDLDLPTFDLGPSTEANPTELSADEGPLATKLALAEEFNAIGDADGARSLAEEVLAEASGDLKSRAQRLLADIG